MNSIGIAAGTSVRVAAQENNLIVDHASYCGHDLAQMEDQFRLIGLPTEYGGPHATVTHMALLGFSDGSYLELIAPQEPQKPMPQGRRRRQAMLADAGPCAWAVGVADVGAEVNRLSRLGLDAVGPLPGTREKPDGTVLQWETGAVRPGDSGSVLPFFIRDKTDRRQRVRPSATFSKQ